MKVVRYSNTRSRVPNNSTVCRLSDSGWIQIWNEEEELIENNISPYPEVIALTKEYVEVAKARECTVSMSINNDAETSRYDHFEYAFLKMSYSHNPVEIRPVIQYCHTTKKCRVLIYGSDFQCDSDPSNWDDIKHFIDLFSIKQIKMSKEMRCQIEDIINIIITL